MRMCVYRYCSAELDVRSPLHQPRYIRVEVGAQARRALLSLVKPDVGSAGRQPRVGGDTRTAIGPADAARIVRCGADAADDALLLYLSLRQGSL